MKSVYVVTCPEDGWDCIVGVFDPKKVPLEDLRGMFGDTYVIQEKDVEESVFDPDC